MKNLIVSIIVALCSCFGFSQKEPVPINPTDWPQAQNAHLTNDGRYFACSIGKNMLLKAVDRSFTKDIPDCYNVEFTNDSRRFISLGADHKLSIFDLEHESAETVADVASFTLQKAAEHQWLAYQRTSPDKSLVLRDLETGEESSYPHVTDQQFDATGGTLLLLTESGTDTHSLLWVSLPSRKVSTVFETKGQFGSLALDRHGDQLAFLVTEKADGRESHRVMRYSADMASAVSAADDKTPGIDAGLEVGNASVKLSPDGSRIFFTLSVITPPKDKEPKPAGASVDVWSYKDAFLQEQQLHGDGVPNHNFAAVYNMGSGKVIKLQGERDNSNVVFSPDEQTSYAIVKTNINWWEQWWKGGADCFLVSTKDGSRRLIKAGIEDWGVKFSPAGRYVVYFDLTQEAFVCYDVQSGTAANISAHIPYPIYDETDDYPRLHPAYNFDPDGWMDGDSAVLVCDRYDLWQLDPHGKAAPINVTNGYGRRHRVVLRYAQTTGGYANVDSITIHSNENLLLGGFDVATKDSGFFSLKLGSTADPEKLTMAPLAYYSPVFSYNMHTDLPLKAKDAEVYVVKRMSATEAPNYFVSTDLKEFKALTDVQPQKKYNWLTAELVHWKMFDGKTSEGILYKPEDFDPKKKYPIIFTFYERDADDLNNFIYPEISNGEFNKVIPYYVSRGYLVFDPNVYFKVGEVGESAYNSIGSAAEYFARMPWVGASQMGLEGISFGAYEVNYLVARTNRFSAAVESAGTVDFISQYDGLYGEGSPAQYLYETTQYHVGATLWQNPGAYIKSSPIFRADKVQTPVLIMHNKADRAVPFTQGIEWFMALRRLNKKVWMLQYDQGDHGLTSNADELDFSTRMAQFFDHYLKGAPAPKWMTQGIPANLKGIDPRLDLDTSGAQP